MGEGRGRLSSLDLLPEEAQDDVVWACRELNRRARPQVDILDELNRRLADKGLGPISSSAFNRKSMRLAAAARRVQEARHLFEGLGEQFSPDKVEETDLVLGEFLKLLIFELAEEDASARTPKQAMELGRAYLAAIQGQKVSSERRRKLEEAFAAKAAKAVDVVAKAKGLSADTVEAIKANILGLRDRPGSDPGGAP